MKILLLGSGGLLGRHIARELAWRDIDVVAPPRQELDLADRAASESRLDGERPDWVVNAAALCHFDACERDPELSRRLNLDAPVEWAELCHRRGIRMVQFSSDYIFDGARRIPYTEEDAPGPLCVYASHKAQLEAAFRPYREHLVLRVAWLFGLGGRTFMSLLPGLLAARERIEIAAGRSGSCLHATAGAAATVDLMQNGAAGLFNLVHRGPTSWEGFAGLCRQRMLALGWTVACREIVPVPFEEMSSSAGLRPPYSVLDPGKAESALGYPMKTWEEGLDDYLGDWGASGSVRSA